MKPSLVIITGVTSGIGLALGEEFSRAGYQVYGIARDPKKIAALTFPVERVDVCDLCVSKSWNQCLKHLDLAKWEKVFLINNAGTVDPIVFQEELSQDDLERAMNVNFYSPLFLAQKFYRLLRISKGSTPESKILNLSTGAAFHGYAGWTAYCASKAALWLATEVFAKEMDPDICQIAALAPGVVETAMQDQIRSQSRERFPDVDRFKALKSEGRLYPPSKPAKAIRELLERPDFPHGEHLDLRQGN